MRLGVGRARVAEVEGELLHLVGSEGGGAGEHVIVRRPAGALEAVRR